MTEGNGQNILRVGEAEAGIKLLRFLEKRLPQPNSMLHRWVRSGQVRVNGKRCKPFDPLQAGDLVRLPPFADPLRPAEGSVCLPASLNTALPCALAPPPGGGLPEQLLLWQVEPDLLVLYKKSGLASHPGSRQVDSVSGRLKDAYAGQAFIPAPAHRLDRQSSGLLLAGRSHAAQQWLHNLFAEKSADLDNPQSAPDGILGRGVEGQTTGAQGLRKEYLVWVAGYWPGLDDPSAEGRATFLQTPGMMRQNGQPGKAEQFAAMPMRDLMAMESGSDGLRSLRLFTDQAGAGGPGLYPALAWATALKFLPGGSSSVWPELRGTAGATLLKVLLVSGRKHQIRIQCAGRGHPVLGDARYRSFSAQGSKKAGAGNFIPYPRLLLHAWRLSLPDGRVFTCQPDWEGPFATEPENETPPDDGARKIEHFDIENV